MNKTLVLATLLTGASALFSVLALAAARSPSADRLSTFTPGEEAAKPTTEEAESPDTLTRQGTSLSLNGRGTRIAHVLGFKVRVFDGAFYMEKPEHTADAIIGAAGMKVFRLKFLRNVAAWRVRDAWTEGFAEYKKIPDQSDAKSPNHLAEDTVKTFVESLPDYKEGEVQEFVVTPTSLEVWNKGTLSKKFEGPALPHFFMEVWFHHSPDTTLTEAWVHAQPADATRLPSTSQ